MNSDRNSFFEFEEFSHKLGLHPCQKCQTELKTEEQQPAKGLSQRGYPILHQQPVDYLHNIWSTLAIQWLYISFELHGAIWKPIPTPTTYITNGLSNEAPTFAYTLQPV